MARFSLEPEALGEFQFAGFTDPRTWRRQWEENGLLGEDSSTLAVVAPDGSFAGIVGWRPVISMSGRGTVRRSPSSLEIGIAVLPEFRGHGYGVAAQAGLVEYLFATTPVHRIQAVTTAGNVAEERALEKAGFRREGVLREVGLWAGRWTDGVMYSVVRGDERPAVETDRLDLIGVLDDFCDAFRRRDIATVAGLLLARDEVMVVTSEEAVLRNRAEFDAFLERYANGATTYSWDWQGTDVAVSEQVAWLLAEGVETAESDSGTVSTPYRMTMLCQLQEGRWKIALMHGSSPHHL